MLLAADGHEVVLLEHDSASPPADPVDAWDSRKRRGLNQFRLPHGFMPRFGRIIESELPQVVGAMDGGGALESGSAVADGSVQVTGVETVAGERLDADLAVDAGGRRSGRGAWASSPARLIESCSR